MRDAGRTYLISGSTGIAEATARLAVESGARVFVVALDAASCLALATDLNKFGRDGSDAPRAAYVAGDLADPATADLAVAECARVFGRIDGVFNVAGLSGRRFGDGPVHECSDEGWSATLRNNLDTAFHLNRAALRVMLAQEPDADGSSGAIVNMSSALSLSPSAERFGTHAYAAAKGALNSLTLAMAATYAPHKIRVNAILPGLTRTPMSLRAQSDAAILEMMLERQPLAGDLIAPEHVARVALFLLGPDSAMMTGQWVGVDAGWSVSG